MSKERSELTIMEAVDHLAKMAELDEEARSEWVEGEEPSEEVNWADAKEALLSEPMVKEIFKVLHRYLQDLFEKEQERFKDPDTQQGIQSLMMLVSEAAQKMDRFSALSGAGKPVTKLKEYKELQKYYLETVVQHLESPLPFQENWEKKMTLERPDLFDSKLKEIKDLEAVRRDKEYELFYLKTEEGKSYFNRGLLRHLKLVGNFDQLVESTESDDPLLKMKVIQDQDVFAGATEIFRLARSYIDAFYKERAHFPDSPFVTIVGKALMALMMAAHADNLLENGSSKGCVSYYSDFQHYLRQALLTEDYRMAMSVASEAQDPLTHLMLNLSHALCCFFFIRSGTRKDAIEWIKKWIQRGEGLQKGQKGETEASTEFWRHFLESDQAIRYLLRHYPSGPLLKTLDALREEGVQEGFDPIAQDNFPCLLFNFVAGTQHVSVIRVPSPTQQMEIQKSEVVEEFRGMMRFLKSSSPIRKYLLINLQDRTNWEDFARADALEALANEAETVDVLTIITLPKQTDFYMQANEYETLNGAPLFIEQFIEQIKGEKECGFFFPEKIKRPELHRFCKELCEQLHHHFFEEKETFNRKERQHFIEIFYQFLVLHLIQVTGCELLSFTCKDAIDTGAAASAGFYGFLKLLTSSKKWSPKEKDLLLWLFHHPALIVRERVIDTEQLVRMVLMLEHLDRHMKGTSPHSTSIQLESESGS